MRLRLFIFCIVTPWILAEPVNDENENTFETSTSEYNDETRRDIPHQILGDNFEIFTQPLLKDETNYHESNEIETDKIPNEQIQFKAEENQNLQLVNVVNDGEHLENLEQNLIPGPTKTNGICSNAEFLIKILTTMIPLLKNDVPEEKKTSYVLEILKDLLKTSPEAAQDYEIMYKINDLMQTLEKYHVKDSENQNLLRTSNNTLRTPNVVSSKVTFKYEVPHFRNPQCTAELLMIIKVVQESIMRLVANPVCKSEIVATDILFLNNVDTLLKNPFIYLPGPHPPSVVPGFDIVYKYINPNLYHPNLPYQNNPSDVASQPNPNVPGGLIFQYPVSNIPDNTLWPDEQNINSIVKEPIQEIPIFEINIPEKNLGDQIKVWPNTLEDINVSETKKIPSHPYDFLSLDTNPALSNIVNTIPPYLIESDGTKLPYNPEYVYGSSPSFSPVINGIPDKTNPSFDVLGTGGTGYISIVPPKIDIDNYIISKPSDLPNSNNLPFDVTGDGSGQIDIAQDQSIPLLELDLPPKRPDYAQVEIPPRNPLPIDVIGNKDSTYINIGQIVNNPDLELIYPNNPNILVLDDFGEIPNAQNRPKPSFEYEIPLKRPEAPAKDNILPLSLPILLPEYIENDSTAKVDIIQNQPDNEFEFPLVRPDSSSFKVSGGGSGFDHIGSDNKFNPNGQSPSHLPDIFVIPDMKMHPEVSNQYDKLPGSLPWTKGKPDFHPDIPSSIDNDTDDDDDDKPGYQYLPAFPPEFMLKPKERPLLSLPEVKEDGSGEIQISSLPKPKIDDLIEYNYHPYYIKEYDSPNQKGTIKVYPPQNKYVDYPDTPEVYYLPNEVPKQIPKFPSHNIPEIYDQFILSPEDLVPQQPYPPIILPYSPEETDVISVGPGKLENSDSSEWYTNDIKLDTDQPFIWENKYASNMPNTNLPELVYPSTPDEKILLIIKDNIEVIERIIPNTYLDSIIRKYIKIIKELISLKKITVEEYVTIVNQYEVLIEYIKHSNINNEILKELLLGMANGGKLDLQAGKSNVVELTYLIKRPTPLVYQPYYYIKYQLPYESFVTRVETILASRPHLSSYPSQLYKAIIPMSKVTETSPDLENYGKDDIIKLTFKDGTLLGTKIINEKDLDMYASLNMLKEINTDYTVDDVYKLMKNLDVQLTKFEGNDKAYIISTNPGVVSDGIFNFMHQITPNNYESMDKMTVKINKQPTLTKKFTKITTKKVTSDDIIANILNEVNSLRSNKKTIDLGDTNRLHTENYNKIDSESTSSQDTYNYSNDLNTPLKINSELDKNKTVVNNATFKDKIEGIVPKDNLALDYTPVYSDALNQHYYYSKKNNPKASDEVHSYSQEMFNLNKLHVKPAQVGAQPRVSVYEKLLDATKNADKSGVTNNFQQSEVNANSPNIENSAYNSDKEKSVNSKWDTSAYKQSDLSIGTKLLDATVKAHNFKQMNDQEFSNLGYKSDASVNSMYTNLNNPNSVNPNQKENLMTHESNENAAGPNYMNPSQTYSFNNHVNSNFDKSYQVSYGNEQADRLNPYLINYSQKHTVKNPIHFVSQYKTYNYDNPYDIQNHYQTYSFGNNLNDNNNNFNDKYRFYSNHHQDLVKNYRTQPNFQFYKGKSSYVLNPALPMRFGSK